MGVSCTAAVLLFFLPGASSALEPSPLAHQKSSFTNADDGDLTPVGVHTAIYGDDGMAVSWSTAAAFSEGALPKVRFGPTSGALSAEASGESASYLAGAKVHHHVVLAPLEPSTVYYYQMALGSSSSSNGDSPSEQQWSEELFFRTAPSSDTRNLTFAVFGDLGEAAVEHRGAATLQWLSQVKDDISLVWVAGDVGYADDSFLHLGCFFSFCYETVFDDFMAQLQAKGGASELPWMVTPGNHEADCHDFSCITKRAYREALWNFTAYNARFKMPSGPTGGNSNMWYSFNAGPAHFVSLDLETGYPGAAEEKRYVFKSGGFSGDMVAWLEADLKAVNRTEHPWVFVAGHHPMYNGGSVNTEMQAALEQLLYDYEVDAMFTGHVHSYERDYPVYQGQLESTSYVDPRATVHLLVGGAGNDEQRDSKRRSRIRRALRGGSSSEDEEVEEEEASSGGGAEQQQQQPREKAMAAAAAAAAGAGAGGVEAPKWVDPSKAVTEAADGRMYSRRSGSEDGDSADWVALEDKGHYGAGLVHIVNETHMHFEYVRTTAQKVFDDIWIVKNKNQR
jgi:hypothetical protein